MRVGIVDYLNSRPLAWAFRKGAETGAFVPFHLPPVAVAAKLADGSLDIGLIPSIEVQRIPGLRLLPGVVHRGDARSAQRPAGQQGAAPPHSPSSSR